MSSLHLVDLLPRLTSLFSSDESLDALKIGCFKYFERGGDCIAGPIGLISGYVTLPFNHDRSFSYTIPQGITTLLDTVPTLLHCRALFDLDPLHPSTVGPRSNGR